MVNTDFSPSVVRRRFAPCVFVVVIAMVLVVIVQEAKSYDETKAESL